MAFFLNTFKKTFFLRKSIFLVFIIAFLSCKQESQHNSNDAAVKDSISFYFDISANNTYSLDRKYSAINKAFRFATTNFKDTAYSKVLYQKNYIHLSLKQYDSLKIFGDSLVNHGIKIKDDPILAKHYYLIAYYFDQIEHNPDSAFVNYNLSKNYFQRIKNDYWAGINLLNMGIIEQNQNDYFGSKETITEALQLFNPLKHSKNISSAYNELATSHRKLLNHEDAIKYYLRAIKISNSKKDTLIYKNNLAATYIDNQDYNKAFSLLNSISKDPLLIDSKIEYSRVLDNLAYVKWKSSISNDEEQFQRPLKIRIQMDDLRGLIASYTHLGEYHSKTNPKKAKSYFNSVIQLSKILKNPRAEKDALKFLMELQTQNIPIRNRYIFLQDSLYQKELKVKTQFAKYKYDAKLIQEDNLRLEKENIEKELEASQQRNQKILTYAIGVPLFLLLGFLTYFFVQRSKRLKDQNKTAKLEATYETEAALSRKLHDDFGGKLNHAMLLLQGEENTTEVLNIVDGLYNQSRDFSREINDVDTGVNFKDFLFGMMGNYSKNQKLIVTGSTDIDWIKMSPLSKKTLFKVLQELMINMQKHSNANLVSVAFKQTKKVLKMTYADDGAGASDEELHLKNGLWNTEKRIEAIGGTIIFDSKKGQGFEAHIRIPN